MGGSDASIPNCIQYPVSSYMPDKITDGRTDRQTQRQCSTLSLARFTEPLPDNKESIKDLLWGLVYKVRTSPLLKRNKKDQTTTLLSQENIPVNTNRCTTGGRSGPSYMYLPQ